MRYQSKAPLGRSAEGYKAQEKIEGDRGAISLGFLELYCIAGLYKIWLLCKPSNPKESHSSPLSYIPSSFLPTSSFLSGPRCEAREGWSVWVNWPQALEALRHGTSPIIAGLCSLKQKVLCPLRFHLHWWNSPFNKLKQRQRFSRILYLEHFKSLQVYFLYL